MATLTVIDERVLITIYESLATWISKIFNIGYDMKSLKVIL